METLLWMRFQLENKSYGKKNLELKKKKPTQVTREWRPGFWLVCQLPSLPDKLLTDRAGQALEAWPQRSHHL